MPSRVTGIGADNRNSSKLSRRPRRPQIRHHATSATTNTHVFSPPGYSHGDPVGYTAADHVFAHCPRVPGARGKT
ncbi:hypothetical protein SLA2020_082220 [Shorea laevis]